MKSVRFFWFLSVLVFANICVAQSNPIPFVGQPLVPGAAAPAGPGFTLTVNGAGFLSGSIVNWNGTPLATTFVSAVKLRAAVPAADIATSGTARVTVVNPGPGGGSSDPVLFSITNPASSLTFRTLAVNGVTAPVSAVTADFNHDGIADLAVIDQAPAPSCNYQFQGVGSIAILQGIGDGTFFKASTLCLLDYLSTEPQQLALTGDLNRDGKVDLVAITNASDLGHIAAYYGNGDGTFSAPHELYPFTAASAARFASPALSLFQHIKGMALGDFYGTGELNVAVSEFDSTGAAKVFILPENNFLYFNPAGPTTGALGAGDFNGDGKLDLADASGSLKAFINNGSGSFTKGPDIPFGDSGAPIANGDFNGDGISDFATVQGNTISVLLGKGDGTFTAKTGQPTSLQTNVSLITADFNGDGKLDLAVVDSINAVSIWLGKGDGTFQAPIDTTGRGDSIVAGDLNGDGQMDLAVTDSAAGTISILLQGSPYNAVVEHPIEEDGSSVFSVLRVVIPAKFTLTTNGVPTCTLPPATIGVTRIDGKKIGPVSQRVYSIPSDKGSNFRIDRSTCQYVYQLGALSMGPGKYRVDLSIRGAIVGRAVFTLRGFIWW